MSSEKIGLDISAAHRRALINYAIFYNIYDETGNLRLKLRGKV